MTVERMDHVGIVVEDIAEAMAFFTALGLEVQGEMPVGGEIVDRIIGLEGVQARIAMLRTPDGHGCIELTQFQTPASVDGDQHAPANALGIRHITFAVDDLEAALTRLRDHGAELVGDVEAYGGSYTLCYVRGPAGIIVELAQRTG
jgi:catechol 2,3-dioxygenase-like lactoylglutathione lyase family enzyme